MKVQRKLGQLMCYLSVTLAERKPDWRTKETIFVANLIFKVAAVREMDQIRVIDMEEEGGRVGPDLRDEEEV